RLKISTIFFAFLAAFSPRTMNSRYVNSFFTSSSRLITRMDKKTVKKIATNAASAGITAAAIASIGSYLLYGSKNAVKNRAKARGWMLRIKAEVLDKLDDLKEVDEKVYFDIVEKAAKKYGVSDKVDRAELEELTSDLKKHWTVIKRDMEKNPKTSKKK
ncbi:hypothetical protein L0Y49_00910, partial [bacterium]|nr:hypothetical protein [bacterium]MCI0566365.1 hypothetical protein [bacterium]